MGKIISMTICGMSGILDTAVGMTALFCCKCEGLIESTWFAGAEAFKKCQCHHPKVAQERVYEALKAGCSRAPVVELK